VLIDDEGRVRLLLREGELDGAAGVVHLERVEAGLAIERSESGGEEESIAFAQRHLQSNGEPEDHVAAGLRAAGFEVTQVARRNAGFESEVKLAEAACGSPTAEQGSDVLGWVAHTSDYRGLQRVPVGSFCKMFWTRLLFFNNFLGSFRIF
jgi:hypothetical protein